jgi:pimeloyl-ACP methyl ester carboxylesterase
MSAVAGARDETPFYVRAEGEDVLAILTAPTGPPLGIAAVILTGGAYVGATNRNRVSVRLARRIAANGFHAVRMDYHGVGDSTGTLDTYPLDRPFVADLMAVIAHLDTLGLDQIVLIGTTCFGARTALAGAQRIPGLRGIVLLAAPVRDEIVPRAAAPAEPGIRHYLRPRAMLRALRDPARRRRGAAAIARKLRRRLRRPSAPAPAPRTVFSHSFVEPLAALVRRRVPVLIGYGLEDDYYGDFCAARQAPPLSELLDSPDYPVTVRTVEGSIHALRRMSAQQSMLTMTEEWLEGAFRDAA